MSRAEILKQLKSLPIADRLSVVEFAVHELREEMVKSAGTLETTDTRLKEAAEALFADYSSDKELTAFTALDGDRFHA